MIVLRVAMLASVVATATAEPFSVDANPALARHVAEFVDTAVTGLHLHEPVTDKITSHSYETMYGQFLLPLRDGAEAAGHRLKVLEIGIGCDMARGSPGASTLLWSRLLPSAERWQAELNGDCARRLGAKLPVNVLVGDQADKAVVTSWLQTTGGGFHVIIDDGGHANEQIRGSLEVLWAALLPGGLYFIEDLHVSRATPVGDPMFTVTDMLHAWSEQLLSSRLTRPAADTADNRRAREMASRHPMPPDVAFVFVQRDAAVVGKLSWAGLEAQRTHASFPDVGGGPLHEVGERLPITDLAGTYRAAATAAWKAGQGADDHWCLMLTNTNTKESVDLRNMSYGMRQQRQQMSGVLAHWLKSYSTLPIALIGSSDDNLSWANEVAAYLGDAGREARLELINIGRSDKCGRMQIGCHEADTILRAVRVSRLFARRQRQRCTHVLKVTGRYLVTSDVDAALRGCTPGWDIAVQNSTSGEGHRRRIGTQVLGFRVALAEQLFGWSQSGDACKGCHIDASCKGCHIDAWLLAQPEAQVCRLALPPSADLFLV